MYERPRFSTTLKSLNWLCFQNGHVLYVEVDRGVLGVAYRAPRTVQTERALVPCDIRCEKALHVGNSRKGERKQRSACGYKSKDAESKNKALNISFIVLRSDGNTNQLSLNNNEITLLIAIKSHVIENGLSPWQFRHCL